MMNDGLSYFLFSRKNMVGLGVGTLGGVGVLGGMAAGIALGPFALAVPLGLYAAGALLTPNAKHEPLQLTASAEPPQIKRELKELTQRAEQGLPPDLAKRVRGINETINLILERADGQNEAASSMMFEVRQTAFDYLPTAIEQFMRLPYRLANLHVNKRTGRTAKQELESQLELLEDQMNQFAEAVLEGDMRKLTLHGNFLRTKFASTGPQVTDDHMPERPEDDDD